MLDCSNEIELPSKKQLQLINCNCNKSFKKKSCFQECVSTFCSGIDPAVHTTYGCQTIWY